jgi:hypothetical protein
MVNATSVAAVVGGLGLVVDFTRSSRRSGSHGTSVSALHDFAVKTKSSLEPM